MSTPENDPDLKDRVIRLMGFLRKLAIKRSTPVLHVEDHPDLLWMSDVERHLPLDVEVAPGGDVFVVPKVQVTAEPELPEALHGWLDRPARGQEPKLRARGPHPHASSVVEPAEVPSVVAAFEHWLPRWRDWASQEAERLAVKELHDRLAEMERAVAQQPESVELVLAAGLLRVAGEGGPVARIHLVTQTARIDYDRESGDIRCVLGDDGLARLEDDELIGDFDFFDRNAVPTLREKLAELMASPVNPETLGFLKMWAERALETSCVVTDEWTPQTGGAFRLDFAPALVLRQRGSYALRQYYERMAGALEDPSTPVPLGLAQLVEPIDAGEKLNWLDRTGATAAASLADDPLFPLPANQQQSDIIRRLGEDSGVVVEGPPGTGKTHTIANLMSALLARGQRILVTSEKAQALRVLKDKLPPQMQDLCVSLTDTSGKGRSALSGSVSALSDRHASFDPAHSERRIAELADRRDQVRRKRADLLERIRAIRESERYQHPEIAAGYSGTLADIVRRINDSSELGWIRGSAHGNCPFTDTEFADLIRLLRQRSDQRLSRREQKLPSTEQLLDEHSAAQLIDAVVEGDRLAGGEQGELITALGELSDQQLQQLGFACRQAAEKLAELRNLPTAPAWVEDTAAALFTGQREHLWHSAVQALSLVEAAVADDRAIGFVEIVAPGLPLTAGKAFADYAAYLRDGGKVKKLVKKPEQKAVEPFLPSVRIAGAAVADAEGAMKVAHHLRALEFAESVRVAFGPLGYTIDTTAPRSAVVEQLVQLRTLCRHIDVVRAEQRNLSELLRFVPPAIRPQLTSLAHIEAFTQHTIGAERAHHAKLARAELVQAGERTLTLVPARYRAPEHQALADALTRHDLAGYQDGLRELERARAQHRDQQRCDELHARLAGVCPSLADDLEGSADLPEWNERIPEWEGAWARACAVSWVTEQTRVGVEAELEAGLQAATKDLEQVTADLAAERAWNSCLQRMTAGQVQALRAYAGHSGKVGKGTGRYAERFRAAAREAMGVAQEAVPAWVMPIKQVLDTIPPEQNAFDVVIVDEASQADLTSSFLLWLAPRVIVVGDDKQCAPSEVAAGSIQPIFDSLDAELPDVPMHLRTEFTPKSSMFSMLRSKFGQLIRLREHFRCMPEIIQWSSNEFYLDQPLVPVRQFGADRLPPLRANHVVGGYVEGKNQTLVNPVEAQAIADSIVSCLSDPAYEHKTFGVVVLQGQRQVEAIKAALHGRITQDVWDARKLRVGTAPDFQGDERQVVWLSMVVAPEQNFTSLTRDTFQRSFNVAVSRAQDQVLLFHSVTLDRLRPGDLRRSLLTHMTAGERLPLDPVLSNVDETVRHSQFDSLFEQRVFLDLVNRGYHVTPQVESNGRRIDLVVTGDGAKLAVECDGDHWHQTQEQLEQDLFREQELKRCGWRFWRVRESTYYLDKEKALASLWTTLESLKIKPILESTPVLEASTEIRAAVDTESMVVSTIDQQVVPKPALAPIPAAQAVESVGPVATLVDGDLFDSAPESDDNTEPTWAELFPWLRECRPGQHPDLDSVSPVHGWWLTQEPSTTAAGHMLTRYVAAVASAVLGYWPEYKPLADAFPTLPDEMRLDRLSLGTRGRNVLRTLGVELACDLTWLTWRDMLDERGVGRLTVRDVLTCFVESAIYPDHAVATSDAPEAFPVDPPAAKKRPTAADAMEEMDSWFDELSDRQLAVVTMRFFADEPATLDELGQTYQVTRQRIQQIESSTKDQLWARLAESAYVSELLSAIRAEIQPVAALSRLLRKFPILGQRVSALGKPVWLVLDKLDDYFEVVEGWALAPSVSATRDRTRLLLEDITDQHGVAALSDLDSLVEKFGMDEGELRAWLEWCEYELLDGHVLTKAKSIPDRAAALLSIMGEPLTVDDIGERLSIGTTRGLAERFGNDERFKRVDRGTWALADWDFEEYTTLRDQIGRIIDAHAGSVPLNQLVGEITSHFRAISESSIRTYASAPPFETRMGLVSRSSTGATSRKGPERTKRLYRHGQRWVYRIVVTSEHLRGSGFTAPVGLATAIGLVPGDAVEFHSERALQSVRWSSQQPQVSSIKRFLEPAEVPVGATVFLHFFDDRLFRLIPATPLQAEEGVSKALWLVGAADAATENAEQVLASAACLPAGANRRQILRAYRNRGDDDVADALEQGWATVPAAT